jgi:hypothetical protein
VAERFVSEREAGRILERAARLQEASRDGADGSSPGISISELERIAAEAGIDATFLKSALAEPVPPNVKRSFLGQVEEREAVIDGELSEDGWEGINEFLTKQGRFVTLSSTPRSKSIVSGGSWLSNSKLDITSRKGRTRVSFRQSGILAYFVGLHAPLITSIVFGVILMATGRPLWIALSLFGAVLGPGVLLYNYILRLTRRKGIEFFQGLSEVIALECHRSSGVSETENSTTQTPTSAEQLHLKT